ncbi:hypothetical protein ACRRTK_021048 [Alexandromys fortis]
MCAAEGFVWNLLQSLFQDSVTAPLTNTKRHSEQRLASSVSPRVNLPAYSRQAPQASQFVKKDVATYWPLNWRSRLCTCQDCMKMYGELDVLFLTDECDTLLAYENKGKSEQATERRDPLMDTLSSMNRVQQVELISEYNVLKTELKDYLKRFADEGTVVKREDINSSLKNFSLKRGGEWTGCTITAARGSTCFLTQIRGNAPAPE